MGYPSRSKTNYGNQRRSGRSIYSVQESRSKQAKATDAAKKAPLAKSDEQWMNDPNHYDWPNLDTPKPKTQTISVETKKEVKKDPLAVPNEKERNYWLSLSPMKRLYLMKELEKERPSKKFDFQAMWAYIAKHNLANQLDPKIEKKLEPQIVETKKTEVLIQPEIVKINSIPEVIAQGPPTKAKTYATGGQSFEVLEGEYIEHRFEKERSRFRANIAFYNAKIKEITDNPNMRDFVKARKIDELQRAILVNEHTLVNRAKIENKTVDEHYYRQEYIQFIKDSIKHGKPVPQEVIEQRPEFQVAQDARRRYEKGLHTSFANKSAAVNAVMFLEKGYKVKRQDGKEIKDCQIQEIGQGISDIQQVTGPIKDIMEKSDLTIAHTSGKYPFLMVAGGVYHPNDKTITMGIFGLKSLAHEWAHWLDYEAGQASRYGYEYYTDGRKVKKVTSLKTALSKVEEGIKSLCTDAGWRMNDRHKLREVYKRAYGKNKDVTPEEKKDAREVVARVGGYWGDPREVWARLVEQYVAVMHGKRTEAAESPQYYFKHPAYWSPEVFAEYKPLIKAEIERRISIARGT